MKVKVCISEWDIYNIGDYWQIFEVSLLLNFNLNRILKNTHKDQFTFAQTNPLIISSSHFKLSFHISQNRVRTIINREFQKKN